MNCRAAMDRRSLLFAGFLSDRHLLRDRQGRFQQCWISDWLCATLRVFRPFKIVRFLPERYSPWDKHVRIIRRRISDRKSRIGRRLQAPCSLLRMCCTPPKAKCIRSSNRLQLAPRRRSWNFLAQSLLSHRQPHLSARINLQRGIASGSQIQRF